MRCSWDCLQRSVSSDLRCEELAGDWWISAVRASGIREATKEADENTSSAFTRQTQSRQWTGSPDVQADAAERADSVNPQCPMISTAAWVHRGVANAMRHLARMTDHISAVTVPASSQPLTAAIWIPSLTHAAMRSRTNSHKVVRTMRRTNVSQSPAAG
jgi:hypothetical protein